MQLPCEFGLYMWRLHGKLFKKLRSLFCDVGPALSPRCQYDIGRKGIRTYLILKKFFREPQGGLWSADTHIQRSSLIGRASICLSHYRNVKLGQNVPWKCEVVTNALVDS